uniref:Methyltransferase FkbM domain-containing protein n=1 Tax=Chromera velia CCMP2878 TaxID=1169474 RepID=A0A0G4IA89_9ALVE|eukprot:Cvel_12480.t1-p1 / transcript=Cvel_12480.t1 / gene=Cvel_12480 / organism=Chromera_velia_CCMP2878 / gene_product=hypothetical protein / transcript_product=hypothetical protein / location=Cvel_scaffold818:40307-42592(-) / protein_length=478 / sequence_SO=supercontig / SO=protein_coding / is_pseudo=false
MARGSLIKNARIQFALLGTAPKVVYAVVSFLALVWLLIVGSKPFFESGSDVSTKKKRAEPILEVPDTSKDRERANCPGTYTEESAWTSPPPPPLLSHADRRRELLQIGLRFKGDIDPDGGELSRLPQKGMMNTLVVRNMGKATWSRLLWLLEEQPDDVVFVDVGTAGCPYGCTAAHWGLRVYAFEANPYWKDHFTVGCTNDNDGGRFPGPVMLPPPCCGQPFAPKMGEVRWINMGASSATGTLKLNWNDDPGAEGSGSFEGGASEKGGAWDVSEYECVTENENGNAYIKVAGTHGVTGWAPQAGDKCCMVGESEASLNCWWFGSQAQCKKGLADVVAGKVKCHVSERTDRIVVVPVTRIDYHVHEVPRIMKFDVQGHEGEAIKGAYGLILPYPLAQRPKLIHFEFEPGNQAQLGHDPVDLLKQVESLGYELFDLAEESTEADNVIKPRKFEDYVAAFRHGETTNIIAQRIHWSPWNDP